MDRYILQFPKAAHTGLTTCDDNTTVYTQLLTILKSKRVQVWHGFNIN